MEIQEILIMLKEKFPKAFFDAPHEKPLKIKIHEDIYQALEGAVSKQKIMLALKLYSKSKSYRLGHAKDAKRIDLSGDAAGVVNGSYETVQDKQKAMTPKTTRVEQLKANPKRWAKLFAQRHKLDSVNVRKFCLKGLNEEQKEALRVFFQLPKLGKKEEPKKTKASKKVATPAKGAGKNQKNPSRVISKTSVLPKPEIKQGPQAPIPVVRESVTSTGKKILVRKKVQ